MNMNWSHVAVLVVALYAGILAQKKGLVPGWVPTP